MGKEERFHLQGFLLQVGSENLWNKAQDAILQGLPFLLLDFRRWQRQLDLLSPKSAEQPHSYLSFPFTWAEVSGLLLLILLLHQQTELFGVCCWLFLGSLGPALPSCPFPGEELRKLQEHTQTPRDIHFHPGIQATGAELALPQPQGLWGHPREPGPGLASQSQGSVPGPLKVEISAL